MSNNSPAAPAGLMIDPSVTLQVWELFIGSYNWSHGRGPSIGFFADKKAAWRYARRYVQENDIEVADVRVIKVDLKDRHIWAR